MAEVASLDGVARRAGRGALRGGRQRSVLASALLAFVGASHAQPAATTADAKPPAASVSPLVAPLRVVGDAIPAPLTSTPGDPMRGRAIVADRTVGLCLLCHSGPFPEQRFQGNLASDLSGAGARWTEGQLRLRIADARRLDPEGLMPSLHRVDGHARVGRAWQGKPVLDAQQVEDVVAFLKTLRTPPAARP